MPTNRDLVLNLLHDSVDELNEQFSPPHPLEKTPETLIYGAGAVLDSLGFVNFVSIVEEKCETAFGKSISLTDSPGSGGGMDPFRSLAALTDYLEGLLNSRNA